MFLYAVDRFLNKIGIPFDKDDKYRGVNGKILPMPNKPGVLKV